ncbi:UNVERIFIED_CONTAM: hypothetical protein K2H54_046766 [Gekko kuhli]
MNSSAHIPSPQGPNATDKVGKAAETSEGKTTPSPTESEAGGRPPLRLGASIKSVKVVQAANVLDGHGKYLLLGAWRLIKGLTSARWQARRAPYLLPAIPVSGIKLLHSDKGNSYHRHAT